METKLSFSKDLPPFQASSNSVEVSAEWVMALINSVPSLEETNRNRLEKYGIKKIEMEKFYSQQAFLSALKEIYNFNILSSITLSGRALQKTAKMPAMKINTLSEMFRQIPFMYSSNHRGGFAGSIKIESFDEKKRTLVMEVNTPYPKEFIEGMLHGFFSAYRTDDDPRQLTLKLDRNIYTINY